MPELIAAVDLGSNSFRLQVARIQDQQLYFLDSLRESVRLAAGLDASKNLDQASQDRALVCLSRFAERLRGLPQEAVRAVGTNTLRVAKNARGFLDKAQDALGFPIDVVAGREEARLIYIGAAHSLPPSEVKRLVVDIGGGSTEFIVGAGFEPHRMESLYMGCVGYSLKFFADGKVTRSAMKQAELAACLEVQAIEKHFARKNWHHAVGSSGTAAALAEILVSAGWSDSGITADGLDTLKDALVEAGHMDRLGLPGLKPDRAAVLPGGLAIMRAVFQELGIERMGTADGALRQGILYDMIGRAANKDMRALTVRAFMKRYHVDSAHAHRVEKLAVELYRHMAQGVDDEFEHHLQLLSWAACLHEIGFVVSHAGFHKHSAYILGHADMPGFSKMEQNRLATLVLGHRGSLDKMRERVASQLDWAMLAALRVAALCHRARVDVAPPRLRAAVTSSGVHLQADAAWFAASPLAAEALRKEASEWTRQGITLSVSGPDATTLTA
jgi:exopolyphosphatase/guanosine-5'-triphosphate,3'-diphosphate pyrophosphatase